MSAPRPLPTFDRPPNAAERRWARTVDPLVARLRREYPHLFPAIAADATAVAPVERGDTPYDQRTGLPVRMDGSGGEPGTYGL